MGARPSQRLMLAFALGGACTSSGSPASKASPEITEVRHVDKLEVPAASATLAGARCAPGQPVCRCRTGRDEPEDPPPPPGQKRLEIRMSADGGQVSLNAPSLGRFTAAGPQEACFYVDVPAGSQHDVTVTARAASVDGGVAPVVRLAEYGAAVPTWYDLFAVTCTGQYSRCDRAGADAWGAR